MSVGSTRTKREGIRSPYWEVLCIPPIMLVHRVGYVATGEILSRQEQDHSGLLLTALDEKIPFVPLFIVPYLLVWIYPLIVVIYAAASGSYDRMMFRYFYFTSLVMTAVECLIWYQFPASIDIRVPAEALAEHGLLGSLTAWTYQRATPWNVFPSAHIAFSFLVLLFSRHFARAGHLWLFVLAFVLIAASVVFVKNHYLVDVAGGMALAIIGYAAVFRPALHLRILHRLSTCLMVSSCYLVGLGVGLAYITSMARTAG